MHKPPCRQALAVVPNLKASCRAGFSSPRALIAANDDRPPRSFARLNEIKITRDEIDRIPELERQLTLTAFRRAVVMRGQRIPGHRHEG